MLKKEFLLIAVVLFGAIGSAVAAEPVEPQTPASAVPAKPAEPQPGGFLHGNIGITYDSLYVFRGFLTYGHHSAIHPFINLNFGETGFGLEIQANRANASGYENGERWDYSPYYMGAFGADQRWETHYKVGWRYFNYPDNPSQGHNSVDLQEVYAGFAFPKLFGIEGLVPGYVFVKGWPSSSGTVCGAANPNGGTYAGSAHVFMLDYALPVKGLLAETSEQIFNFHIETVYNDGMDPRPAGGYTSSDWTHVMMGVSTDLNLGHNLTFTPGVYHQITMEDDPVKGVSPDHNITWASLTVKYTF